MQNWQNDSYFFRLDWLLIFFYLLLVAFGWVSIFSSTESSLENIKLFSPSTKYGKQSIWILCAFILILVILFSRLIEIYRFSIVIYGMAIALLLGLFVFGKEINGAKSWYSFGGFSIQPSEFVKIATALAISRLLSDSWPDNKSRKILVLSISIIMLPVILIVLQPDPGSALILICLVFVLYREGFPDIIPLSGIGMVVIFILTIAFGAVNVILFSFLALMFYTTLKIKEKYKIHLKTTAFGIILLTYIMSVNVIYKYVLKDHHRDRINIMVGNYEDNVEFRRGVGYNLSQSMTAIGSGGLRGKGFLEGSMTRGGFVPEQSTDYIFCTVGEQWGFIGTTSVILVFCLFICRIFYKAEKQPHIFSRVYGYCVGIIFTLQLFINTGMTIGMVPTIGIPLPFFSYGGSSLWAYTVLLFIFIKLDASKKDISE